MAQFIPEAMIGHIYTDGKDFYLLTEFQGAQKELACVSLVDKEGNDLGDAPITLTKTKWNKMQLTDITDTPNNQSVASRASSSDLNDYVFSFDENTGEIIVTSPAGKEARLKSIKGEPGDSVFQVWAKKTGKDPNSAESWEEFKKLIRGKDGLTVNGVDAPTPYEEWKSRQNGTNDSYDDFIKSITGAKGRDGVDGKDGDTWEPHLSENGILYFENTRTHERKQPKNISGPQGPGGNSGNDGQTWKPVLTDNGQHLHFENDRGDKTSEYDVKGATGETGEQGPDGLSAYDIWIKDGHTGNYHDFLLWISQQAQKGDKGEDGDTYIPHLENGCLIFVSKKGKQINCGNIVGPQGPDGKPGLDGHNLRHEYDYQDLKDYVCPVQKMSPRLITSTTDLGSGDSARNHMKQTLHWINNIRKEGSNKKNRGTGIQEFFWWCSGADRRLLRMTRGEHSKYMGIGTVIFFTALMAMLSSMFAISYVFGITDVDFKDRAFWLCAFFAIMWGLMIFFLDRFITNTMYSDGKVTISWLEFRSALPRILISIFLGIVISAPLELKIFNQEIDDYLQQEELSTDLTINSKKQQLDSLNNTLNASVWQYSQTLKPKEENYTKKDTLKSQGIEGHKVTYGPPEEQNTGIVGYKTDLLKESRIYDDSAYQKAVENWENKTNQYRTAKIDEIDALSDKIKSDIKNLKNNFKPEKYGLYDRLHALHEIAKEGYQPWTFGIFVEQIDTIYLNNPVKDQASISSIANDTALADSNNATTDTTACTLANQDIRANDKFVINKDSKWNNSIGNPIYWFLAILSFLYFIASPYTMSWPYKMKNVDVDKEDENEDKDEEDKEDPIEKSNRLRGILWPCFVVVAFIGAICCDTLFNALPYYIFSAVGMIMMLFILIDVSPVFYKMMLADGQYEQYLHKEKSVTQDLIRLNFATSISKVNQSEVARLAPMIFSRPWKKIKKIIKAKSIPEKPELSYGEDELKTIIEKKNLEIFENVLGMKKALIEAAYQAWYRDMKDCKIGHTDEAYRPDPNDPIPFTPEDYVSNHDSMEGSRISNESEPEDGDEAADNPEEDADFASVDNDDEDATSDENSEYEHFSEDIDDGSTVDEDTDDAGESGADNSSKESTSREDNDDEYEKEQSE